MIPLLFVGMVLFLPLLLGRDKKTRRSVFLDRKTFDTHYHLIGATGTGKSTAILQLLFSLLRDPRRRACVFLIDCMGGLSHAVLRWIASRRHCPDHVRERLVYIEPANEDYVLPFHQLDHHSEANLYYQIERTMETILRGRRMQDIASMMRLRRWLFNLLLAAALLRYPLGVCKYLLHPGSNEHRGFLRQIPDELRHEWSEILNARGGEAIRTLDSTRNTLAPFYNSSILHRMSSTLRNHHDVTRFIDERRVVVWNISTGDNQFPGHLASTTGGFVVNDILSTARHLASIGRPATDTFVILDEFQNYVNQDLYEAIPTVRQWGLKLLLAHQSFAQLKQGDDLDLSSIVYQLRSRLMFANDADDADRLAHEIAMLQFDPYLIKDQIITHRQRVAGYQKVLLHGDSTGRSDADSWNEQQSYGDSAADAYTYLPGGITASRRETAGTNRSRAATEGGSRSTTQTHSTSESLIPVHEDVAEVTNRTYQGFEELRTIKGGDIRKLSTGDCLAKFVNDPQVYGIGVQRPPIPDSPQIQEAVEELKEQNFQSDIFLPAAQVDREAEEIRQRLLTGPVISVSSNGRSQAAGDGSPPPASGDGADDVNPFRQA